MNILQIRNIFYVNPLSIKQSCALKDISLDYKHLIALKRDSNSLTAFTGLMIFSPDFRGVYPQSLPFMAKLSGHSRRRIPSFLWMTPRNDLCSA